MLTSTPADKSLYTNSATDGVIARWPLDDATYDNDTDKTGTHNNHKVTHHNEFRRTFDPIEGLFSCLPDDETTSPITERKALPAPPAAGASLQAEDTSSRVYLTPSEANNGLMKLLLLSASASAVAGESTTTVATTAITAENLNSVLGFDNAVFGQAVKESTECIAFLKVAFDDALMDSQKTLKNKMLIAGSSAATFVMSWATAAAIVGVVLGRQLSGSNAELLIKSIEGVTKIWAAYKLYQLIQLGEEFKDLSNVENPNIPSNSGDAEGNLHSALEAKYKEKIQSKSEYLYGNLGNIVKYMCVQTAREGGELGVLSGVTLTPYLIAGTNIAAGVGTIAISGVSGITVPIAAYYGLKGTLKLASLIEQRYNHTDWVERKCGNFINASGNWVKNMLVLTLLSVGVHELEEVLRIDVKLWDLKTFSPLFSEKLAPLSIIAALVPYDSDPTFWQATIIFYAWTKYAAIPTAKFAFEKFTQLYNHCKNNPTEDPSAAIEAQIEEAQAASYARTAHRNPTYIGDRSRNYFPTNLESITEASSGQPASHNEDANAESNLGFVY